MWVFQDPFVCKKPYLSCGACWMRNQIHFAQLCDCTWIEVEAKIWLFSVKLVISKYVLWHPVSLILLFQIKILLHNKKMQQPMDVPPSQATSPFPNAFSSAEHPQGLHCEDFPAVNCDCSSIFPCYIGVPLFLCTFFTTQSTQQSTKQHMTAMAELEI